MNDTREAMLREQRSGFFAIGKIEPDEFECRIVCKTLKPRFLQSRIVVSRHIVDADHGPPLRDVAH
jgi:hypothetical protein